MHIEYEVRVLDIEIEEMRKKLEALGAKKIGSHFQKRYVYDMSNEEKGKFMRLRTNGDKTTLTVKHRYDDAKIGGVTELETEVGDFARMHQILEDIGYKETNYQENKRETYHLEEVEIDIDTWPLIPTYMEIEGKSEEVVQKYIEILGVKDHALTTESIPNVYKKYDINLDDHQNLTFE
ncbi:MAG: class IV adenylate cyclase [Bacilli bacterium]|nr:class IV adenylate cyclase [Bacilli bacterium]